MEPLTKVNLTELLTLGNKCLQYTMDFYPGSFVQIIEKDYLPILEKEMQAAGTIDPFDIAIPFYNSSKEKHHKIWWLASAQYLLNQRIEQGKIILQSKAKV